MAIGDAHAPGTTPLDPDEAEGLLPDHISTQGELNEWEQSNIVQGQEWALKSRKFKFPDGLTWEYVRELHKNMFAQTWKWAGSYRTSDKNLGIHWPLIPEQVKLVCDNARFWIDNETFNPVELSVRFHHKLVAIHPIPNGNGRHARLIADLLLMKYFQVKRLPWGGQNLTEPGEVRDSYLKALHKADQGVYNDLIEFSATTARPINPSSSN